MRALAAIAVGVGLLALSVEEMPSTIGEQAAAKKKKKKCKKGHERRAGKCRKKQVQGPLPYPLPPLPAGAKTIWKDDCANADPIPAWGVIVAARVDGARDVGSSALGQIKPGRVQRFTSGGAYGGPFRRLTIYPEDLNQMWGTRTQLGELWHGGPTALYHEGQHLITETGPRIGQNVNPVAPAWRMVFQTKQIPDGSIDHPGQAFQLELRGGRWVAVSWWDKPEIWSTPYVPSVGYTMIRVEAVYSSNPFIGWIQFTIGGARSPRISWQTLGRRPSGASMENALLMGLYQDASHTRPATLDVDCPTRILRVP